MERLHEFDRTLVVLALPLTVLLTMTGLWTAAQIVHSTYDNCFYGFDELLPFAIARAVAQFCTTHRWAWNACTVVYNEFLRVLCALSSFDGKRWTGRRPGPRQVDRGDPRRLCAVLLPAGSWTDAVFYGGSRSYLGPCRHRRSKWN